MKRAVKHLNGVSKEVKNRTFMAISAGFGLVIALAWNDAIRSSVDKILEALNVQTTTYIYKIIAAVIVTIIAVIGLMILSKKVEN